MSTPPTPGKRTYDATRRRERAEEERRATRGRVIDAATRLFTSRGYTATTIADIAREAGVAVQSVYTAGRSKADLLHLAVDRAVAGDDERLLMHERPTLATLAEEKDPVRQVRLLAELICDIQERSEPMQTAYREAAAVDPTVAASVKAAHLRRLETFGVALGMLPEDRLRHSAQDSIDTLWAVASSEVFLLLRTIRGWSWEQIRKWLARTLVDVLLPPQP